MNNVVAWLESPAGEAWSREWHRGPWTGNGLNMLASLKDDDPLTTYPELSIWSPQFPQGVVVVA